MSLLLLLAAPAFADEGPEWSLWSWTAAEAVPDTAGASQVRLRDDVGVTGDLGDDYRFEAAGGVRLLADPAGTVVPDLYQVALSRETAESRWRLGRITTLGPLGIRRLDGFALEADVGERATTRVWGGRLWHPEVWDVGDTVVIGAEASAGTPGRSRLSGGAGWEAHYADDGLGSRVYGFAAMRRARGGVLDGLVELDPAGMSTDAGEASHAVLRGTLPAGRNSDVGASIRWEGLAPVDTPLAVETPLTWLGDNGYGALDFDARLRSGAATLSAHGGPAWHDEGVGGSARGGIDLGAGGPASIGVAVIGAGLYDRWIVGGVAHTAVDTRQFDLTLEGGWFRFQPLAGPPAGVWEGRARAGTGPIDIGAGGRWSLVGEVACGADRVLAPWVRGGLALRAESRVGGGS